MRRFPILLLLMSPLFAQPAPEARKLLAVFAHPDDESSVGPLLARYAREKATGVYLAIATNGDKGVRSFAGIAAGPQLAAARSREAACASEKLGIAQPRLLGLPDGALGDRNNLATLVGKLQALLTELKPDVIVTWGPDGLYGHPDHRLVSAAVTQLVQSGQTDAALYYTGLPASRVTPEARQTIPMAAAFAVTRDAYLHVRVRFSAADEARARQSLACHASQFDAAEQKSLADFLRLVSAGTAYLRHWRGGPDATDLFPPTGR